MRNSSPLGPKPAPGVRFGRLTVIEIADPPLNSQRRRLWLCRCDCGAMKVADTHSLRYGDTASCGCSKRERTPDLTGRCFGAWAILRAGENKGEQRAWECRCSCGHLQRLTTGELKRSRKCATCGRKQNGDRLRTHGACRTPTYHSWASLVRRCTDPTVINWHNYGGRGITVCARWTGRDGFAAFLSDVGERPSADHSIDRIDNDGGYWCGQTSCPDCGPAGRVSNCRWATRTEQARNRRPPPKSR